MKDLRKGFTLIELLIVIAIIGVLTSLLMANFITAKEHARDAQRKSDLAQIRSALELYRTDQASYPPPGQMPNCGGSLQDPARNTTYIQKMPCDPLNPTIKYTYTQAGAGYKITACLENKNDSQGFSDAACSSNWGNSHWGYQVTNP